MNLQKAFAFIKRLFNKFYEINLLIHNFILCKKKKINKNSLNLNFIVVHKIKKFIKQIVKKKQLLKYGRINIF